MSCRWSRSCGGFAVGVVLHCLAYQSRTRAISLGSVSVREPAGASTSSRFLRTSGSLARCFLSRARRSSPSSSRSCLRARLSLRASSRTAVLGWFFGATSLWRRSRWTSRSRTLPAALRSFSRSFIALSRSFECGGTLGRSEKSSSWASMRRVEVRRRCTEPLRGLARHSSAAASRAVVRSWRVSSGFADGVERAMGFGCKCRTKSWKSGEPVLGDRRLDFCRRSDLVSADGLLFADLGKALGKKVFQLFERLGEAFDAFLQLVVGHTILGVHLVECGLVDGELLDVHCGGLGGIEFARQWIALRVEFKEQLGRDGEKVTAGQLDNFTDVAEAGAHDYSLVAEVFVVVVNGGD